MISLKNVFILNDDTSRFSLKCGYEKIIATEMAPTIRILITKIAF